jgi:hypothetical protein
METDPKTGEPVWVFPFSGMRVGDSFFVPTLQPANMIYVADTCAKREGLRVKSFAVVHDGYMGVRVWRIG